MNRRKFLKLLISLPFLSISNKSPIKQDNRYIMKKIMHARNYGMGNFRLAGVQTGRISSRRI